MTRTDWFISKGNIIYFINIIRTTWAIFFRAHVFMTERMFQAWEAMSIPRFFDGGGGMEIFYDNGYFEIFAEGGLAVFSVMTYPVNSFTKVLLNQ